MRLTAIHSQDPAAVNRFIELMLHSRGFRQRRNLHALVYPTENPVVAAVVADNLKLAVQWASYPNGSFVVVDGEIYNAADLLGVVNGHGSNDAQTVYDLYSRHGTRGIARLDAAAAIVIFDAARA
jgi:hypothetical protein